MNTVHLHHTLTPQAYADLLDEMRRHAEAQRRLALQDFVQARLQAVLRPLRQGLLRVVPLPRAHQTSGHCPSLEA